MASNIIDAKSVLLENKTECSTMSLDVKLDLNCLIPLSEALYGEITPTKKAIDDYINHEYNLLIDELALESSLEKLIEKYIYNNSISEINLEVSVPSSISIVNTQSVNQATASISHKHRKVKANTIHEKSEEIVVPSSTAKQINKKDTTTILPNLKKDFDKAIEGKEPLIDNLDAIGNNFDVVGDTTKILTEDEVKVYEAESNKVTTKKFKGYDPKLGNNGKIYFSEFKGNQYVKIIAKTENIAPTIKAAGTIGSVVEGGSKLVDGYSKYNKAKTTKEKGGVVGETIGEIGGGIIGGSAGGAVGTYVGSLLVLGLVCVGATISAPVSLVIVGGCALTGIIVGDNIGEKIGGTGGKKLGEFVGSNIEKSNK